MPQGTPLHNPPGPRPTGAITRPPTKTQVVVERKAAKDVKAKEVVEKKLVSAVQKADEQQQLIVNTKARATKAADKADDICLKLAHAMALQDVRETAPPHRLMCFTCTRRARIFQERHQLF